MSESGPEDEEILGRLPRTRPGRRSPRRDEAAERRARSEARASAASERAGAEVRRERTEPEAPAAQPGIGDALAGAARTGVAVAGGTIGLGLKVAGGALGAIRGTIERR